MQGLFSENKERLIVNCVQSVMAESNTADEPDVEAQLHCLRRLFASKAGFHAFTNVVGLRERLGTCFTQWRHIIGVHAQVTKW